MSPPTVPPWPLSDYEVLPPPTLTHQQLAEIVARHRLGLDGPVHPLSSTGVVHGLWALGSTWVLRVPKNETMCLGDHRCEAVAIPVARSAGVRTPELVAFDDSLDLLDVPYSIVERVHGDNLIAVKPTDPDHDALYRQLGEQLALLHAAPLPDSLQPWLRSPDPTTMENFVDEVIEAGVLHVDGVEWMLQLSQKLDAFIATCAPVKPAFVHNDVKPDNAMLDRTGLVHLIDWGDAGYGDPVVDFHSLPLRSARAALDGYRRTRHDDPSLEARLVRRVVARSLSGLRRTPLRGPSWYRPIAATLTDLLTFAIDCPETWNEWTASTPLSSK